MIGTYKVEVVSVLEAVEKPYNPFCSIRIRHQSGSLEHISFRPDMSLLTLPQHIRFAQLYGNQKE
jgi:hypothetical protein